MSDVENVPPSGDELARSATLERRIAELEATMTQRIVHAELKAEAIRQGIVDLDGLKLVDPAAVTVDENGDVQGVVTVMQTLKRNKPWLFAGASTSSAAPVPPAQPPKPRLAKDMSHDEWQAARAELVRRR